MSDGAVDLVRSAYERFDDDLDGLIQLVARDVEWVSPPDSLEPGTRIGPEGVRAAYDATAAAWEGPTHAVEAIAPVGDRVMATVVFRGHGRGSGMDAEITEHHVWTVADGRVTRFAWFYNREEALAEAGQPTPSGVEPPDP